MILRTTTLIVFLVSGTFTYSQETNKTLDKRPLNTIGFNFIGDISIFSFNYERLFPTNEKFMLCAKLGLGYNVDGQSVVWGGANQFGTVPMHISGNFGKGKHLLELGMGATFIQGLDPPLLFYPILGYRLAPFDPKKFSFRIYGWVPINGVNFENVLVSYLGFNFARAF